MITIEPLSIAAEHAVPVVEVSPYTPACPHRLLFIAQSNSGKSTVMQNLWLKVYQPFFNQRIFVFCPNADEVAVWLGMHVDRSHIYTDYKVSDVEAIIKLQIKHVLKASQHKKTPKQCLLVLEDLTQSPLTRSRNSRFNTMLSNCRHYGITVWASAQVYHSVERIARINFDNYVFFRIFNRDEITQIADDNAVDAAEFMKVYKYATEHRPFGFLYVKRSPRQGVEYFAHFCGTPIDPNDVEKYFARPQQPETSSVPSGV